VSQARGLSRSSCGRGDANHLAPGAEGGVACGTVLVGGQAVATELEVAVDAAVDGEEALGVRRRLEPLHLPLSSPGELVRHLGAVVELAALPVLDAG